MFFCASSNCPKAASSETLAMVELQLEKLSPMPVTQIVWTLHVLLPRRLAAPSEARGFADRHRRHRRAQGGGGISRQTGRRRVISPTGSKCRCSTSWRRRPRRRTARGFIRLPLNGQNAALVAWWFGGALRNLSFVVLPPTGDRAKSLKEQLAQLAWAGELEGWLTAQPKLASGRRWRRRPANGKAFCARPGRAGGGDQAVAASRNWPRARRGAPPTAMPRRGPAARGIFRALSPAVCGSPVAARPGRRREFCMRSAW